jgi:hypothetical protein
LANALPLAQLGEQKNANQWYPSNAISGPARQQSQFLMIRFPAEWFEAFVPVVSCYVVSVLFLKTGRNQQWIDGKSRQFSSTVQLWLHRL